MDALIRDTICHLATQRRERWIDLLSAGTHYDYDSWHKIQPETKLIERFHKALDTL